MAKHRFDWDVFNTSTDTMVPIKKPTKKHSCDMPQLGESIMDEWLPTGINSINEHITLRRGEMTVIAGRPGTYRKTLACKMINSLGIEKDYKIGVFSLDLLSNDMARRILLKRNEKKDGEDYLNELSMVTKNMVRIEDQQDYMVRNKMRFINTDEMSKICHEWKKQMRGLDYIFIDYLGLIDCDSTYNTMKTMNAIVSRSLKALAKELNCVLVLISPLARNVDKIRPDLRPNHSFRPIWQDLRVFGVEHEDVALLLYSDEKYNPDSKNKGKLEVIVGKDRDGSAGDVIMLDINEDLLK